MWQQRERHRILGAASEESDPRTAAYWRTPERESGWFSVAGKEIAVSRARENFPYSIPKLCSEVFEFLK